MIIATLIFFLYRTDLWFPYLPILIIGTVFQFAFHHFIQRNNKPAALLFVPYVITYLLDIWALIACAIYSNSPTRLDIFPHVFQDGKIFGNGFIGMAVLGMMFLFLAAGSSAWGLYFLIQKAIKQNRNT